MIDETFPSFHDEHGRIANPDVAQEVANLEKPVRAKEFSLKKEAEEGLTAEQKKNIEIMGGVEKKYPNAFEMIEDELGRVLWGKTSDGGSIIFGKEGAFMIPGEVVDKSAGMNTERIDGEKLASLINDPKNEKYLDGRGWRDLRGEIGVIVGGRESFGFKKEYVLKDGSEKGDSDYPDFHLCRYDLTKPDGRNAVRELLLNAEEVGKKEKERVREIEITSEDILDDL